LHKENSDDHVADKFIPTNLDRPELVVRARARRSRAFTNHEFLFQVSVFWSFTSSAVFSVQISSQVYTSISELRGMSGILNVVDISHQLSLTSWSNPQSPAVSQRDRNCSNHCSMFNLDVHIPTTVCRLNSHRPNLNLIVNFSEP
jgi:hypothetical protein